MEIIFIQLGLILINVICGIYSYKSRWYKLSIFNWFAAGICFMGLLIAIGNL